MDERLEEFSGDASLAAEIKFTNESFVGDTPKAEQIFEKQVEKKGEKMDELLSRIDTHTANLQATSAAQVKDDAHALSQVDEEERVNKLLSLADTKGVVHAVNVARTLEDFYALDTFRDTLIERFHEKIDQAIK
ncbi:MAG: hypothetical protein KIH67_003955 [Candidatus Moranbacteria bacterium]|nr:hypothetical protein [Candidatus Moranbacteria bacterium]